MTNTLNALDLMQVGIRFLFLGAISLATIGLSVFTTQCKNHLSKKRIKKQNVIIENNSKQNLRLLKENFNLLKEKDEKEKKNNKPSKETIKAFKELVN